MSSYAFQLYELGSAWTNVPGIITQTATGQQWDWNSGANPTLTIAPGATPIGVQIDDGDGAPGTLEDDSTGQVLANDTTIGGTTYPAGTALEDEYEITLTDGMGNDYRFVAISTRHYLDPFTYADQFLGYTWEGAAPPAGTTLSYIPGSWQDFDLDGALLHPRHADRDAAGAAPGRKPAPGPEGAVARWRGASVALDRPVPCRRRPA